MIDIKTDGHVHTRYCNHATGEMDEYVRAAITLGLDKIVFLEHCETRINYFESTWVSKDDFKLFFKEGERLKKKYSDLLKIGLGVEVGYNPKCVREIIEFLDCYEWDRIGISYHFLEADNGQHINMVSRRKTNLDALKRIGIDKVISTYYHDLNEAVELLPGTVLCHLDAVLRHYPGPLQLTDKHNKLIRDLLLSVKREKMALEVNTSGFKLRNEPFPTVSLLKEAVKLGIPLAPGSDAHRPEDVGRCFDKLPDLL